MIKSEIILKYFNENRKNLEENFAIKLHRSISWLKRAENEIDDNDAKFIFLWISFNATYTGLESIKNQTYSRKVWNKYFEILIDHDKDRHIYEYIWKTFSSKIRLVLRNQYLSASFWKNYNNNREIWADEQEKLKKKVNKALANQDSVSIMIILFDRLYVLRNQIFHGHSTWNSKVNREQLNLCTTLLAEIIPIFMTIMLRNPSVDWGKLVVPVLNK